MDDLLSQLGGKQGPLNTLEKLEQAEEKAANELSGLLEQLRQSRQDNPTLNDAVVKAANEAQSKHRQVEAVNKLIDASQMQNNASLAGVVEQALGAAAEKAEEVQSIIGAWSSEPGNLQRTSVNEALLERVRRSDTLRDISKYLGRFREIFSQGKRNYFAYGRGEKYSLEPGNDLPGYLPLTVKRGAAPKQLLFCVGSIEVMRKYAPNIEDLVQRNPGAIGQEQKPLVVIELLHSADGSDIGAAGLCLSGTK